MARYSELKSEFEKLTEDKITRISTEPTEENLRILDEKIEKLEKLAEEAKRVHRAENPKSKPKKDSLKNDMEEIDQFISDELRGGSISNVGILRDVEDILDKYKDNPGALKKIIEDKKGRLEHVVSTEKLNGILKQIEEYDANEKEYNDLVREVQTLKNENKSKKEELEKKRKEELLNKEAEKSEEKTEVVDLGEKVVEKPKENKKETITAFYEENPELFWETVKEIREREISKVIKEAVDKIMIENPELFYDLANEKEKGQTPEELANRINEELEKRSKKEEVVEEKKEEATIKDPAFMTTFEKEKKPEKFNEPQMGNNKKSAQKKDPIVEGSLADLVKKGVLPNNLSEEELLKICNQLGINAKSMNAVPRKDQIPRLLNDKEIKLAQFNQDIRAQHEEEQKKYDEILSGYDKMDTSNMDEDLENSVHQEIDEVQKAKDYYEKQTDNIKADSVLEHLDMNAMQYGVGAPHPEMGSLHQGMVNVNYTLPGVGSMAFDPFELREMRMEHLDKKSDKVNNELREQYQILETQKRQKARSKVKQQYSDYRIKKTMDRIEKLSKRQGKITGKQFGMMNQDAQRCIEQKNIDIKIYGDKQKAIQDRLAQIKELEAKRAEKEQLETVEIVNTEEPMKLVA